MKKRKPLTAVAWCAGCKWYLPENEAGDSCPGDECGRTLRRRVGWIDESDEERRITFRTKRRAKR